MSNVTRLNTSSNDNDASGDYYVVIEEGGSHCSRYGHYHAA